MKLVTFETGGRVSFGILRKDGIVDLGSHLRGRHDSLAALVAAGDIAAAAVFAEAPADYPAAEVRLLKPLHNFGKCFCIGVNYPDRNAEYKDGSEAPKYPSLFIRFPESFTGPDAPLIRPPESPQLDYEGELVLVVGKAGRRIPQEHWAEHVFGWTIGNEGTIRDWVRHGKFNVTPGKNWPATGSLGPWLTTLDEAGTGPFRIVTRVNGEVRQDDVTDHMTFPLGRIVEYVSTFCPLAPGDIIFTGTPTGSGARFDPPVYLVPGDTVSVEIPGLGKLTNPIADEIPTRG